MDLLGDDVISSTPLRAPRPSPAADGAQPAAPGEPGAPGAPDAPVVPNLEDLDDLHVYPLTRHCDGAQPLCMR
jgi:hypothetical protein